MKPDNSLPLGKLPHEILGQLLSRAPIDDPRVLLGPGIGLDCAVVDVGDKLLVFKSDPITFASNEIGWYGVQVNANDIATMGAEPRWFLVTLLLPEKGTTVQLVESIMDQIYTACRELDISVIGGHTEISYGLARPILVGTMIGEVAPEELVTPRGAQPGDRLLLTKGIPIEAAAILARELPHKLRPHLTSEDIERAKNYLYQPGISVLRDARIAVSSGRVHAMHDPTEGGLSAALWELADASGCSLWIDPGEVHIHPIFTRISRAFEGEDLDPMAAIASGALLLAVHPKDANNICTKLEDEGINCAQIGEIESAQGRESGGREAVFVWQQTAGERRILPRPERDEIARLFEE